MANVYLPTPLIVPRIPRNGRIYGGSVNYVAAPVYVPPPTAIPTEPDVIGQEVIPFEMSSRPEITDYNTLYAAKYGQFPTVRMWLIADDNNGTESMQKPAFTFVDGLLSTIYFDLGEGNEQNGYLIIQP